MRHSQLHANEARENKFRARSVGKFPALWRECAHILHAYDKIADELNLNGKQAESIDSHATESIFSQKYIYTDSSQFNAFVYI